VSFQVPDPARPAYLIENINGRLASAILVYGTARGRRQPLCAERLESRLLDQYESAVPIFKDFEATRSCWPTRRDLHRSPGSQLRSGVLAGRLDLDYSGAAFLLDGTLHASERDALLLAARNRWMPPTWWL